MKQGKQKQPPLDPKQTYSELIENL